MLYFMDLLQSQGNTQKVIFLTFFTLFKYFSDLAGQTVYKVSKGLQKPSFGKFV